MSKISSLLFMLMISSVANAQTTDTITISSANVNTKNLITGVHRWLVYGKKGSDSSRTNLQIWTREIVPTTYEGKEVFAINQTWENTDTIFHTALTYCDRNTFQTYFHKSWWLKGPILKFDFIKKQMFNGAELITEADTSLEKRMVNEAFKKSCESYFLDWHLDLEVFQQLPYKENTTFLINFYDPGQAPPRLVAYTVSGSGTLNTYDNQKVECWLLTQRGKNSNETFWISKRTKEVLKLEQSFGKKFRYKIKLGFSN